MTRPDGSGFTLVEVLVATLLLGLALVGLTSLFVVSVRTGAAAREETAMLRLAREKAEELRSIAPSALDQRMKPGCRGICESNCACGPPECATSCCDHLCYPRGCAAADRAARGHEDPVPDPEPGDDVHEALLVRAWTLERVNLGTPAGCAYRITVVVGSRSGLFAPPPEPPEPASWTHVSWEYVVGSRNPRRVLNTVYRMR